MNPIENLKRVVLEHFVSVWKKSRDPKELKALDGINPRFVDMVIDHVQSLGMLNVWSDMKCAPKDGTVIRCLVESVGEFYLRWDDADSENYDPAWVDEGGTDWEPIGWMPKPPGPEKGED